MTELDEIYYLRQCKKCNEYFFVTAKHGKLCFICITPGVKKLFKKIGIKHISYTKMNKIKKKRYKNIKDDI